MALLSSFGKEGVKLGLLTRKVDIEDTGATSKYFSVTEFPKIFTAGKNSFAFNGSSLLKDKSEVQVECLDSYGNSLYLEQAKSQEGQFTDASKFVVSIHVYNEIYNGPAKIILVGTTTKGEEVRWIGNLTIDKTLDNSSKVRFTYKPTLEVRPLLYPIVDTARAAVEYPPPPVVASARAVATILSEVNRVTVTELGANYTSVNVSFDNSGTGGHGATATATIGLGGNITSIQMVNRGMGYLRAPKVVITGDGSPKAAATAVLKSVVTAVNLVDGNGGSGYTFTPRVIFTSTNGNGSGAQADATVVNGTVTRIDMRLPDGGGNGYTTAPLVSFDIPDAPPPPDMNVSVNFSASFTTYAANPATDANKNTINTKQTDIDYRLVISGSSFVPLVAEDFAPTGYPSKVFNTQMEGQILTIHVTKVKQPYSTQSIPVNTTASFVIKKVLDSRTAQLADPFYYAQGTNQFVTNITEGRCFLDYRFVLYNTAPDSSKLFTVSPSIVVPMKDSYAEVTYRNIKCFTGFVARHKVYRKSSYAPGDFQLISDERLLPTEMLSDQVTFNKFYDKMGSFYNQPHINKYWFAENPDFRLYASTSPINSMRVEVGAFSAADGNKGIIVKTDTLGGVNDNIYRHYNASEFNRLSGSTYNSNFVNLRKDVLYVLATDVSLRKDAPDTTAKVSFFFTSSIASIANETGYDSVHKRWKLGEVTTKDTVAVKYFNNTQYIYFTPKDDYFGTLVVVPYHCSPTLANISLKVSGDYGFSSDCQDIRIPFPISTANEAFDIKAELLDINSNVVYSKLGAIQTFDADGESLIGKSGGGSSVITVTQVSNSPAKSQTVTITGQPYFPDMTQCDNTTRMVGWHTPTGDSEDGKLCYTNVARLYIDTDDYIVLHDYQDGVEHIAKAIAVQYDFAAGRGRKIFINQFSTKETFP